MGKNALKFGMLLLFLIGCVVALALPETREFLAPDNLQRVIESAGVYAHVVFVLIYALLIVLTVPGTLVTVVGATLFPLLDAFLLTLAGAMIGAIASFTIGRQLGREAVEEWISSKGERSKIRRVLASFEANGIMAVAYMRIAYVPFSVLNYAAPLTGIRFKDYVFGTFLGILPGSFIFVFMGNTLSDAWKHGHWAALLSFKSVLAIMLFVVSLALPKLLKRFEKRSSERENS